MAVRLASTSPHPRPEGDRLAKVSPPLNAVYMLQKVDMPSYLADNIDRSELSLSLADTSVVALPHRPQQQQSQPQQPPNQHYTVDSFESRPTPAIDGRPTPTIDGRPTPALDGLPGSWPKLTPVSTNGFTSEHNDSIPWPHTNGKLNDGASTTSGRDTVLSGAESTLSLRSKRSIVLDPAKRSPVMSTKSKVSSSEDDGYFTALPPTTRSNGKAKSPLTKPSPSSIPSLQDATSTGNSRTSISSPVAPSISALPPVRENVSPDERLLQVPRSAHRASSPPAFSQASSSLASVNSVPPNKLAHRHTLEVPNHSRISRESQHNSVPDDAVVSATGRFSPATPNKRRPSSQLVRRATRSIVSETHLDELQQDEDAARWTEHIRQKRASKRKRDDDEDRVVVGTKVDQNHVNWVIAYNMLTGIRFTVSRTNAKIDRELTDADFDAKHKFSFDITGNELTPSAKYDFKFKDYAPWVFRHLRSSFHLDPADYLVSLTSKYILSELGSPGKSGSFFYFSRDYKYIIKTIHHAEHKFLRKVLRQYYDHVQANPNTLLSQFYGLHRVKIPYGRKIHFVVMNNLFPPHRDIHRTFDLKGSTIGRDFKEEELEKNPRATMKDLNWLRRNLHLEFGPTKKHAFVEQMKRDVALLQRLKIMDYSMLVGIHDLERGNEENLRDKTLQVFQPGGNKGDEQAQPNMLVRTPSKLENARKARELRQLIKSERPVPMEQTMDRMPDFMAEPNKRNFYFYSDDGGFRATHEDNTAGEEIYYLGIIDCLTHVSSRSPSGQPYSNPP